MDARNPVLGETAIQGDLVTLADQLPPHLTVVPVSQTALFPGMVVPIVLSPGKLVDSLKGVIDASGHLGIVLLKPDVKKAQGSEGLPNFYSFGVASKVLRKINLPDNQVALVVAGLQRFKIEKLASTEPVTVASVTYLTDSINAGMELEALIRSALAQFKQISKDNPLISEEVKLALMNIDGPSKLTDFIASVLVREPEDYQRILRTADVNERLQQILVLLKKELDVQAVQKKIQSEINEKVASSQREFYLQEQLRVIQKELGGYSDGRSRVVQKFKERVKGRKLSPDVKNRLKEEFEKLSLLNEQSSEYSVSVNYLDWITALPWGVSSEENFELKKAQQILEADHFGLKEVKERILEFLAVKKLKKSHLGSILCLVGPPGTGKTSVGKSIARALNRKFFRFSVGGMRDEAEIKGHRRTYVAAMPGRMLQGLKRLGVQNPVFLIDEIDKIGSGWVSGGDPASALLELLDPEQNKEFLDHYIDMPFDCSQVFFVTTANSTDSIPPPLLDRMEVIFLHGYTDNEKFRIAKDYLVPKQLKKNGLKRTQLAISDKVLRVIIQNYARDAGVRSLEKILARFARKSALKIARGSVSQVLVNNPSQLEKYLGPAPFSEAEQVKPAPGVAVGLAWTPYGGDVLRIESLAVQGRGGFVLTGTLGKVMQESANIAYTYVRDQVKLLDLERHYFDRRVFHVHVPAGATPKDGPSAGLTLAASLYSSITGKSLPNDIAMTGEITLSGRVLPVGGIKEKLLAARRNKIRTVILPRANAKELRLIEPEIKKGLELIRVNTMNECLKRLFKETPKENRGGRRLQ